MQVEFFVQPGGWLMDAAIASGSSASSAVSAELFENMIQTADRQLQLGGNLVSHLRGVAPDWQVVSEMDNAGWQRFLAGRAKGREWNLWFGKNSGNRYFIAVYS